MSWLWIGLFTIVEILGAIVAFVILAALVGFILLVVGITIVEIYKDLTNQNTSNEEHNNVDY